MREAVIVAARRTPIGRAYRGAFNNTYGATLGAHSLAAVVEQAGIDAGEVDDIAINDPDAWLGGVHLTKEKFWRCDDRARRLV